MRHILVIDDNNEILIALEIILKRKNYLVSLKDRFDNFPDLVRELNPDLILLDKNLGWVDGTILCKQLKSDTDLAHIPVIFLSAFTMKKAECLAAGADDFIEKPFDMNTLLDTLAHHIHYSNTNNQ